MIFKIWLMFLVQYMALTIALFIILAAIIAVAIAIKNFKEYTKNDSPLGR